MFPGLKAIPAFNGAGSTGSGAGGALTFTLDSSATSASSTITIPASAQQGDWAVLFDAASVDTGSIGAVTPSGWTNLASSLIEGTDSLRLMTSHRILGASPGGTTITGMDESKDAKILLIFRPSTSIISTVASSWNAQATTGDPTLQTVSASGVTTPLIVVAAGAGPSIPAFATETPAMTNLSKSGGSTLGMRIGYTIYNSSPSDQSIDIADGGYGNVLQSGYVRFT